MTCSYEYSLACLPSRRDSHWLWLIVPLGLLLVFLLYVLSRPHYARLSTHAYELITSDKRSPRLSPSKQHIDALNQHANDRTPTAASSRTVCKETPNNSLVHTDSRRRTSAASSVDRRKNEDIATNNSHLASASPDPCEWNELRTPTLANYPDLIDAVEAKQNFSEGQNVPLLPDDVRALMNRGFNESDPSTLGRLWFFLEYNPYLRQLYLTIVKARDLRSVKGCPPTTFVRAELVPVLNVTFCTDVVRNNANPDYLSETTFNINLSEFPQNALKLTVHEVDRDVFHTPIGTVYYPLDHLLLAQRAKGHAVWRHLLPGKQTL